MLWMQMAERWPDQALQTTLTVSQPGPQALNFNSKPRQKRTCGTALTSGNSGRRLGWSAKQRPIKMLVPGNPAPFLAGVLCALAVPPRTVKHTTIKLSYTCM